MFQTDTRKEFDLPVRIVDSKGKLLRSSSTMVHFNGSEDFPTFLEMSKAAYNDIEIESVKLGRMHGRTLESFDDMTIQAFMRKNRLRPSTTTIYLFAPGAIDQF